MTALSLLADLGTIGVRVEADPCSPGELVVRGPTRRLTPGLLGSIRDRKPELLEILAASPSWRPFAYSAPDEPAWISDPSLTVALADVRRSEDGVGRPARQPGGDAWGPAVEPGAVAAFCPALSSAAESNHVALATRNGPVFSRFNIDPTPTSNGHRVNLDVLTITSPSGPSRTTAWASVITSGLLA